MRGGDVITVLERRPITIVGADLRPPSARLQSAEYSYLHRRTSLNSPSVALQRRARSAALIVDSFGVCGCLLRPRLHEATGCLTGLTTGCIV